jgi:hypothetical protein
LINAAVNNKDAVFNAHIGFARSGTPAHKISSGPEDPVPFNAGSTFLWSIPRKIDIAIVVNSDHQTSWRVEVWIWHWRWRRLRR